MATATLTNGTPTAPASAKRGFGPLRCILCGQEASISIDLDDVATCRCGECDETFDLADVRATMARWAKVLAWVDLAPAVEE